MWGDAKELFSHLISQLYLTSYADFVLLCGDFNARMGKLHDTIEDFDGITKRKVIDASQHNSLLMVNVW